MKAFGRDWFVNFMNWMPNHWTYSTRQASPGSWQEELLFFYPTSSPSTQRFQRFHTANPEDSDDTDPGMSGAQR